MGGNEGVRGIFNRFGLAQWGLILVVIVYAAVLIVEYSRFQQLPSPIYGGDLYHQLGAVNHVKYGGNPFVSFSTLSGTPTYFPMSAFLVGNLARLFNLPGITAMYISSVIFTILALFIVYLVLKRIFENGLIALFGTLAYLPLQRGVLKYTEMAFQVGYPLFFLSLLCFFQAKRGRAIHAWITGIVYGLLSISHAMGFFIPTLLMPFILLYLLIFQYAGPIDWGKVKSSALKNIGYFALMLVPGLLIAQIYWFPFFARQLAGIGFELESYIYTFGSIFNEAVSTLFSFSGLTSILVTLLVIFSVLIPLVFRPKDQANRKRIMITYGFGLVLLIMPFHFIITKPLFGIVLVPNHMLAHCYALLRVVFACLGLYILSLFLRKRMEQFLLAGIIIVMFVFNIFGFASWYTTDRWVRTGMLPIGSPLEDVEGWIVKSTDVNDVFMTTKEAASALNALTGRKFLTLRYNHVDPTLDSMQRELDQAIILYGNNDTKRIELLKKYQVKYLYWDLFWFDTEFVFAKNGTLVDFFDPLTIQANDKNYELLKKYDIGFVYEKMPLDPSKRDRTDVEMVELFVILPTNFSQTKPWNPQLDKHLQMVRGWQDQNEPVAKIFKVVY